MCVENGVLRGEVVEEGCRAHSDLLNDVLHAGLLEPALAEHRKPGLHQRVTGSALVVLSATHNRNLRVSLDIMETSEGNIQHCECAGVVYTGDPDSEMDQRLEASGALYAKLGTVLQYHIDYTQEYGYVPVMNIFLYVLSDSGMLQLKQRMLGISSDHLPAHTSHSFGHS